MKAGISLSYDPKSVPKELVPLLKNLSEEYPVSAKNKSGITLDFVKTNDSKTVKVSLKGKTATIKYGQLSLAARGISSLLSGLVKNNSELSETMPFSTFGIMLDCSRNAVMTVEHFKNWLRRLALMGYNMAMLYTEDTYKVEGEPIFGLFRGAYKHEELKEIDAYASELGIEMIPCIQTLGHMEQVLKWPNFSSIKDTSSVMMADSDITYEFIEKMITQWTSCFKTRKLHIGMDETHDLGKGKYREKFGEQSQFEIFNRHLARVVEICKKHGYAHPMIWSDMYFRIGCESHDYYDKKTVIPEDVKNKIHKDATLVYWDYYHKDKDFYDDWIERHRALGFNPVVASGIWTWSQFWHNTKLTHENAGPCIDSCIDKKIDELIFTMWGDEGAYCDFDSAMAGLAWCAEKAFHVKSVSDAMIEKRFAAVCGGSYKAKELVQDAICAPGRMWDDPFFNMKSIAVPVDIINRDKVEKADTYKAINKIVATAEKAFAKLAKFKNDRKGGDMKHIINLCDYLILRAKLFVNLFESYEKKDKKGLQNALKLAKEAEKAMRAFDESFREMWLSHNKAFGLEVIQIRNNGIIIRLIELQKRLKDLLGGKLENIEEIDEALELLRLVDGSQPDKRRPGYRTVWGYRSNATGSLIF